MITDDELLLYYYRDGLDAAERARIGTALSMQPELAQRLHRLVAQLDTAAERPDVPVPRHVQQRWHDALERAARNSNERGQRRAVTAGSRFGTPFRWQAIAAVVAILAIFVTLRVALQPPPQQVGDASPSTPAATAPDATAYERGLQWHLASTEQRLANLDNAKPDERAELIGTIIEQNRLYALAAERANEPQLARVLRAFTPILESLADDHGDASASDIAQLNFELRVMQARLNAAANAQPAAPPVTL